ncbi:MAG: hypothetical protein JNM91_07725 [Flavobacteriales bacterium]|nr:hypothetical protein [Flavobacteriales bacterium]
MALYRFRVLIDDKSEAFRDIEIRSNQTFLDFHKAIKKAFGFTGEEMACFYVSDEEWGKGNEIPLADMGFAEEGTVPALMHETQIADHMRSTKQRFVYAYDYLHMWMFMCELIHAGDPVKGARYPKVVMSVGTPPGEHSRMDPLLLPGADEDEENMREEAEEIYDADEGHDQDGDDGEDHDEFGHGDDDGMSGHEELPEDYH